VIDLDDDLDLKPELDSYSNLESLIKSIASAKRILILDELAKYEEGRTYTELRKAVEILNIGEKRKSIRIDFHLEELRKNNFIRKDRIYSLFHGQDREVYKLTYFGRNMQTFVTSLIQNNLIVGIDPGEGMVYKDSLLFPPSLDVNSLVLVLDITREFERIQTIDEIFKYRIISDRIQKFPPLNNLLITFEFNQKLTEQEEKQYSMDIMAFWNKDAMEKNNYSKEKCMKDNKLLNGLIYMIQQSLSHIREVIYDIDANSAKKLSDLIFDYLDSNREEKILEKIEFTM
jgi:hypothetical protein